MTTNVDGCQSAGGADIALELLRRMQRDQRRRKCKTPAELAAQQARERMELRWQNSTQALQKINNNSSSSGENERINLSALFSRLDELRGNGEEKQGASSRTEIKYEQRTTEVEISVNLNKRVFGLERINDNYAQTDRYLFDFENGSTLTIKDKWSGKSTTIWGDPHVDVDDVEGANNGDFKDLTGSERLTTFMLQDGTRLTITALDSGVIEQVDIFHGSQHLQGYGSAASDENANKLFSSPVTSGDGYASVLERGDVIAAGGDGNDWFDEKGNLVWGKTTGPVIYERPNFSMEVKIKQTVSEFTWSQGIDFLT